MRDFLDRHLYMTLLILSCLGMSITGLVLMPDSGEEYGDQPALAATAINQLEQNFAQPLPEIEEEEDEEEVEIPEYLEEMPESSFDSETFDAQMEQIDEAIQQMKEKRGQRTADGSRPDKAGRYPQVPDAGSEPVSETVTSPEDPTQYDFIEVGDDYFNDALFIGDSRQQGFGLYSGMDNITVYADRGYQIYDTSTKAVIDSPAGKLTVYDALAVNQHKFKKVYIMFGVNEMTGGASHDVMTKYYYSLIHEVKRMQPDAIIYLEGVFHVTKELSDNRPNISNTRINEKNEILKNVAKDEGIVFLDLNEIPEFTDENGALVPEATDDGIHLHNGYISLIKDYLYKHAVEYKGGEDTYPYVELTTLQEQIKAKLDEATDSDEEAEVLKRQEEEQKRLEQEQEQKERENVTDEN